MRNEPGEVQRLLARRRAELDAVRIRVAVFGVGQEDSTYQKRLEVAGRLGALSDVIEVLLPEDYPVAAPLNVDDAERAVIEASDLIVCIHPPEHAPLGMYTEFARYVNDENLAKWYLIRPHQLPEPLTVVEGMVPRIIQAIEDFYYEPDWWKPCDVITQACINRIKKVVARLSLSTSPKPQLPTGGL